MQTNQGYEKMISKVKGELQTKTEELLCQMRYSQKLLVEVMNQRDKISDLNTLLRKAKNDNKDLMKAWDELESKNPLRSEIKKLKDKLLIEAQKKNNFSPS